MDLITPTAERIHKTESYDRPERSQSTHRLAYRVHSPFEAMQRRGDITIEHLRAAQKLTKHYMGASGVCVSSEDGAPDPDAEYPIIYHGQVCAKVRSILTKWEWFALTQLIEETATLEQIGTKWLGCKQRGQAHIAGKSLVINALERLATHWGIKQKDP